MRRSLAFLYDPRAIRAFATCFMAGILWAIPAMDSIAQQGTQRPLAEQSLEWTRVGGTAIELGVGANGIVFAVDREYNLWRWEGELGKGWRLFPLHMGRVAPDPQGKPWGIAPDGRVHFYNGLWWQGRGEIVANDIGVGGKNGEVFVLTRAGSLARWQEQGERW